MARRWLLCGRAGEPRTCAVAAQIRPDRERGRRRRGWLLAHASESQVRLQVVADQAGSKHPGDSRNRGIAGQPRWPVTTQIVHRTKMRAFGEIRVSVAVGQETSRCAKAGPAIRRAHTRWLVHAAEGKRVLRTHRHEDRRVDEAAGLAAGDKHVVGEGRADTCVRARAGISRLTAFRVAAYVREQQRRELVEAGAGVLLIRETGSEPSVSQRSPAPPDSGIASAGCEGFAVVAGHCLA
jgi:hypothetical protein